MSINVFNKFVVTGHRGPAEPVRKLLSQPKDNDPNAPTAKNEILSPRSGNGKKPMGLSVRRVTDFTALTSVAKVDAALRDPGKFQNIRSLRECARWATQTIGNLIAEARSAAARAGVPMKPVLIVIGEHHLSQVSTLVVLAAISSAAREAAAHPRQGQLPHGADGLPRLLIEMDESELANIDERHASALNDTFGGNVPPGQRSQDAIDFVKRRDDLMQMGTHHAAVKYHMGQAAGLTVHALEKDKTDDSYLDQREAVMLNRLQAALDRSGGAPVVVTAGSIHLGALHDAFHSQTTCIALAEVPVQLQCHDTLARKRYGYVMSNPGVKPFRSAPEALAEDFDFIERGRGLGIDLPGHLQSAASALAGSSSRRRR